MTRPVPVAATASRNARTSRTLREALRTRTFGRPVEPRSRPPARGPVDEAPGPPANRARPPVELEGDEARDAVLEHPGRLPAERRLERRRVRARALVRLVDLLDGGVERLPGRR